ncbi:phospholipase D-like domain-containing protein [Schlesneria sp.]|uniref:phospholipase D-like domain-containing protein n=1 Tax=Schlesneria sp. TaxID=2762018 RepID=UPI002EFE74C6
MTNGGNNIYVRKNVVSRWKGELNRAEGRSAIFSPYLTRPVVTGVFKSAKSNSHCEIYTLFDSEAFASGASDIRTLKKLKCLGAKIYAVTGLHAKIVIIPPAFASVGSQNLTKGGTSRREATVVITDPNTVHYLWSEVQPWCESAIEITNEMIEDMIKKLPPLRKRIRELRQQLTELNREIELEENGRVKQRETDQREAAAKAIVEANRQRQIVEDRRRTAKTWNSRITHAQVSVRAKVKATSKKRDGQLISLVASSSDLTKLTLPGGMVPHLVPFKSYLCIIEDTWRLGFARLVKTRITFVGRSLRRRGTSIIGGEDCEVWFNASTDTSSGTNLACNIRLTRLEFLSSIAFDCWFDGSRITIHRSKQSNLYFNEDVETWKNENTELIAANLTSTFLSAVLHDQQIELSSDAEVFFGARNTQYILFGGAWENCPMIMARRI